MGSTGTAVQWREPNFGAKYPWLMSAPNNSPYPLAKVAKPPQMKRLNVRMPVDLEASVDYLAKLWSALDKAAGLKRRKWKKASVVEQFIKSGIDNFALQIGGWPTTDAERAELLKRPAELLAKIEQLAKANASKAKK